MDFANRSIPSSNIFNTVPQIPKTVQRIYIRGHYRMDFQYHHLERDDADIRFLLLHRDVDDEHLYFPDIYHRPDLFPATDRNCLDICVSLCLCAHGVYYGFH